MFLAFLAVTIISGAKLADHIFTTHCKSAPNKYSRRTAKIAGGYLSAVLLLVLLIVFSSAAWEDWTGAFVVIAILGIILSYICIQDIKRARKTAATRSDVNNP